MAKFKEGELVRFKKSRNVYEIEYSYEEYGNTIYVFKDTEGMICRYEDALESVGDITIEGGFKGYTNQEMIDRIEKATSLLKNSAPSSVRDYNVGDSNYADFKIQPWDIWLEYGLNPWDADIVKRVLRSKESQSREMDYEKIIHICQERIRQIKKDID
jgi:hypothetical protein